MVSQARNDTGQKRFMERQARSRRSLTEKMDALSGNIKRHEKRVKRQGERIEKFQDDLERRGFKVPR